MSKIARFFINQKAFPNVGFLIFSEEETLNIEKRGNVTALYGENQKCLGYNIESEYFKDLKDGYHPVDEDLEDLLNRCLSEQGFEAFQCDKTPRIVIGYVQSCEVHPDSDHLHVCQVDVGNEVKQIVCGASNVCEGIKVVAALSNAIMPNGKLIVPSALRGVPSEGMLCSEWELGLIQEKKRGILILDEDAVVGDSFF